MLNSGGLQARSSVVMDCGSATQVEFHRSVFARSTEPKLGQGPDMNVYQLKQSLDRAIRPGPDKIIVDVASAWAAYRSLLTFPLEDEASEELAFNVAAVAGQDTATEMLEVYLGRLIDARNGAAWRTVEIQFYDRFVLTPELRWRLPELQDATIETACSVDDLETARLRLDGFVAHVEGATRLWELLPGAIRVSASCDVVFW